MRLLFKDFGYKVIRLKYFIIIVGALVLEIATLTLYLLKLQDVVEFELFSMSILYGAISGIIVILAIGILVLMRVDKKKDAGKIKELKDFQRQYRVLSLKHLDEINRLIGSFENEKSSLDSKLEYAELLEKKYDDYLEDFSGLEIPVFLSYAHKWECDHLTKEKQFYSGFSSLLNPDELKNISNESEISHGNFLKELHGIEKSLRLIV
jgi:hypothetical protein